MRFGCVHLESAVVISREPNLTALMFPELFRMGIADAAELRISYVASFRDDGAAAATTRRLRTPAWYPP